MNQMELMRPVIPKKSSIARKNNDVKISTSHQWNGKEAAMLIDVLGNIMACSPAAESLLGRHSNILSGAPVKEVFPELPMTTSTPLYNLAYAAFRDGIGDPIFHVALTADGKEVPVELHLSGSLINGKRTIKLNFKACDLS